MEPCAICGKTTDNTPHTICAKCGSTVCQPCAQHKKSCPVCGYEG